MLSGEDKDWLAWSFATSSALQQFGWQPLLGAARAQPGPIDEARYGPAVCAVARNLCALLAQKTRGKAQTCARLQFVTSNGLEVWRQLYEEYQPVGDEPSHALLAAIIQPKSLANAEHRHRQFSEILLDWENLIARYELESGERVSNSMKCAAILGWASKATEDMLRAAGTAVRHDYPSIRTAIREQAIGRIGAQADVPRASGAPSAGSSAMEVDALSMEKPVCSICKKTGHTKDACRYRPGGPGKPPGSGKGVGG